MMECETRRVCGLFEFWPANDAGARDKLDICLQRALAIVCVSRRRAVKIGRAARRESKATGSGVRGCVYILHNRATKRLPIIN
jgi:hypothetical protein